MCSILKFRAPFSPDLELESCWAPALLDLKPEHPKVGKLMAQHLAIILHTVGVQVKPELG